MHNKLLKWWVLVMAVEVVNGIGLKKIISNKNSLVLLFSLNSACKGEKQRPPVQSLIWGENFAKQQQSINHVDIKTICESLGRGTLGDESLLLFWCDEIRRWKLLKWMLSSWDSEKWEELVLLKWESSVKFADRELFWAEGILLFLSSWDQLGASW